MTEKESSIIILFEVTHQTPLIQSLLTNMRQRGLSVDAWDASLWKYVDKQTDNTKIYFRHLLHFLFRIPKAGTVIRRFLGYFVLKNIVAKYDVVDIHFFSPTYYQLLNQLISQKKDYKITVWGSDYYRASHIQKNKQKYYYENAKIIHIGTREMREDFLKYLPAVSKKIRLARFGISQLGYIDNCINNNKTILPLNLSQNKIIITCGYNGSKGQQHECIINAMANLRNDQKDRILLLFPMTYGVSKGYIEKIRKQLLQSKISHHIFSSFLSKEENAELRVVTDIVVNIQVTDALSGSLQEHLYAENILLVGNWLPYQIFDENGIFYLKTSIENLGNNISYCIDNLEMLKQRTKDNHIKIKKLSSWESISSSWVDIYNELLS
ncbi:hypothetical protein AGMMS50239_29760 [Bacteroidia bacterium]|nr:hypothetical protein AGMMS50239_29760 [Bacteroidia bacterium]